MFGLRVSNLILMLGEKGNQRRQSLSSFPEIDPVPPPPIKNNNSKQLKPMLYRLIISLVALGIAIYLIIIGQTEPGIAICGGVVGYWMR
jgi:hypothetical protein